MDLFQLLFFDIGLCSAVLVLEFWFFTRFTNNRVRPLQCAAFVALSCAILYAANRLHSPLLGPALIAVLLFVFGVGVYRAKWGISAVSAVLVCVIMLLSFGVFNSATGICSPFFMSRPHMIRWYLVVVSLFQIGLAFLCYRMIDKMLAPKGTARNQFVLLIFVPLIMISMAGEYISDTVYGAVVTVNGKGELSGVNHVQMLVIQLFSIFSVFCIVYAYRRLAESYGNQVKVALLEQEKQHLKSYVDDVQSRYAETRSFRHDIKNHLAVVKGLIDRGEGGKASQYLESLGDTAADISELCRTGNPAVDILLGSKLGTARACGIRTECALELPSPCAVSDAELCVVIANAMDNAIRACRGCGDGAHQYIRVTDSRQGDFYMLDIVNGCEPEDGGGFEEGVGLSNIRSVAEKHGGRVSIERQRDSFRLTVLFIIWQQPGRISQQNG